MSYQILPFKLSAVIIAFNYGFTFSRARGLTSLNIPTTHLVKTWNINLSVLMLGIFPIVWGCKESLFNSCYNIVYHRFITHRIRPNRS